MVRLEEEYKKILNQINEKIDIETDKNKLLELLQERNKILQILSNKKSNKVTNIEKKKLDIEDMKKFLSTKAFSMSKLNYITILFLNHKKIKEIINKNMVRRKFKFASTYKNSDINFARDKKYLGVTLYSKSLSKNFIFILKKNKLSDYVTLIHELGHARTNDICRNVECKNKSNDLLETYSKFLELVFAGWLKVSGMKIYSYNVKLEYLKDIRKNVNNLKTGHYEYFYENINSWFYEYQYSMLKSSILALYLYEMYKKDPTEILNKIDLFLMNLKVMSEEQLLDIFGLDKSIFYENSIFINFSDQLKEEKRNLL